jgi:hypothetical protein
MSLPRLERETTLIKLILTTVMIMIMRAPHRGLQSVLTCATSAALEWTRVTWVEAPAMAHERRVKCEHP